MLQFSGGRVIGDRVIAGYTRVTLFQSSDRLANGDLAFESSVVNPSLKTNQVGEKPPFLFVANRPVFLNPLFACAKHNQFIAAADRFDPDDGFLLKGVQRRRLAGY